MAASDSDRESATAFDFGSEPAGPGTGSWSEFDLRTEPGAAQGSAPDPGFGLGAELEAGPDPLEGPELGLEPWPFSA